MNRLSQEDSDLSLIQAIGDGDTVALQALYERHGAGILSFLIGRLDERHVAEEVLQDVMLAVWKSASTFRGDCKVTTWILTIANRLAINAFHRRKPHSYPLNEAIISDNGSVPAQAEKNLLYEQVDEVYRGLPIKQREVVQLFFYHGLTQAETAQVLGVPEGTVKSRLHHARQTMRRLLQMEDITHA